MQYFPVHQYSETLSRENIFSCVPKFQSNLYFTSLHRLVDYKAFWRQGYICEINEWIIRLNVWNEWMNGSTYVKQFWRFISLQLYCFGNLWRQDIMFLPYSLLQASSTALISSCKWHWDAFILLPGLLWIGYNLIILFLYGYLTTNNICWCPPIGCICSPSSQCMLWTYSEFTLDFFIWQMH